MAGVRVPVVRHVGYADKTSPRPTTYCDAFACLWFDTSETPRVIRRFDPREHRWVVFMVAATTQPTPGIVSWTFEPRTGETLPVFTCRDDDAYDFLQTLWMDWSRVHGPGYRWDLRLAEPIGRLLKPRGMGDAGHNGKPAFLACAVLAALLDVSLERVFHMVANYRRSRKWGTRTNSHVDM